MSWIVENFQIPVPVGDCSIHFLVNEQRKSVEYAFIMDGGTGKHHSASEAIVGTLKCAKAYLKSTWKIEGEIKFNLWVVTHWNDDHFRGVMDLITGKTINGDGWRTENFVKSPKLYCGRSKKPSEQTFVLQASERGFSSTAGKMALGLDMFSGSKIFNDKGNLEPSDLDKSRPRFCIVGADGHGILVPRFQQVVTPNQSSILAVLFWPGNVWQCCFYAGGDGNPELERAIISEFLNKKKYIKLGDGLDLIKLDYHGSSQENIYGGDLRKVKAERKLKLAEMPIGLFKPKNILVTPGNLHGHPTFDVVHCLFDLLRTTTGLAKDTGKPIGRVWTTRSPYWANKQSLTTKDLNPSHNQDLKDIHKKELQAYQDPTKKYLGTGMLMAVEAEGSEKRLKRAKGLKAWKKKIRQQEIIEGGHNPTDYRVKAKANTELIELLDIVERHIPKNKKQPKSVSAFEEEEEEEEEEEDDYDLAIDEEKDKKEEEAAASAQFDYDYVSYDDVMNLRFSGIEMWNLICNQGIVLETEDPFFIIHFSWDNGKFRGVKCLGMGMDGFERKNYKTEPLVPRRYSNRLAVIKEAQKQRMIKLLNQKAEELKMAEESKRKGLFYTDSGRGKDQDNDIDFSGFELIDKYNTQDFKKQNVFTHISQSNVSTTRKNFTGTGLGGFSTRPLGNISLQVNISPGISPSTSGDKMFSLHGLTFGDFSSTVSGNPLLESLWAASHHYNFIKGLEPGFKLKYGHDSDSSAEVDESFRTVDDKETGDEDFLAADSIEEEDVEDEVLDDAWEDGDEEIDLALETLNGLQQRWQTAWKDSQSEVSKKKQTREEKERIEAAIASMKSIKEEAEKAVADFDPTLFTGKDDVTSLSEIQKRLVLAITYISPDFEAKFKQGNGRGTKDNKVQEKKSRATITETKAEKQKREAKAQAEHKEDKELNTEGKRQTRSGTVYGIDNQRPGQKRLHK
ncbi:Uncharacterized protein LW94_7662 [Fusarium fujikuroi]|nr:Uncharacterized protein LW94_7662 [Fusarium fujikuroi]